MGIPTIGSTPRQHYDLVVAGLSLRDFSPEQMYEITDVVVRPMGDIHRGTLRALHYAKQVTDNVQAVSVITDNEMRERVQRRWDHFAVVTEGVQLVLLDYEYRDILTPLVDYIGDVTTRQYPGQLTTVVVPEFVSDSMWGNLLHNQTANILCARLRHHDDVVIIDVPFHIHDRKM